MAGRDLSRVKDRECLRPQGNAEPYWQRLRPGCFLGYAPSSKGGEGSWFARAYDADVCRYRKKLLGAFPGAPGGGKFAVAKQEAEQFAALIESGGHAEESIDTVADACRLYAQTRPEADARFRRYVYGDVIATRRLDKLRKRDLDDWRSRLSAAPSLISRSKEGERRVRTRALSTINRDMAVLRAALNKVMRPGVPGTPSAWQEALKAHSGADGRRTLYLDREQRRSLLSNLAEDALPFVRALCLLPMRPGALAALDAAAFDRRTSELTIGRDKAGKARRIKVPSETAAFLAHEASNKLPDEPLFARSGGGRWDRNSWKKPIAKAIFLAGLPMNATAYTLRHSTITDLVSLGLPLLTIAQISGTSAEMIERHYGHLANDAALKALDGLSL